jgi:hypothetical protein
MRYSVKPGQVSYGEAIGILLLENYVPYIPGDVANATTYGFPVRFQRVPGFSVARIMDHDMTAVEDILRAAAALQAEGVRAVTGDCGFMALYQDRIAEAVEVPVFLSSLMQIPFMRLIVKPGSKIGVVTANAASLDDRVLAGAGIQDSGDLVVRGLEKTEHFSRAVFLEEGTLDPEQVEAEVLAAVGDMRREAPDIRAILLECSLLPPYGAAVREATGLPVFDYVTMINYVYSTVVKQKFTGYM